MASKSRSFGKAILTMTGTIIGAGIIALPATFSRVGFWPGTFLFFFLSAVVIVTHLLYVEVILASKKNLRLPGYVRDGLGTFGFRIATLSYPLQIIGSNVAYIILGGEFFAILARHAGLTIPTSIWQLTFWLFGALTVLFGLRFVAAVEFYVTGLLLLGLVLAVVVVSPFVDVSLIQIGSPTGWLLPFGVFLFSLSGLSIISEVVELTERKRSLSYGAVTIGTGIAALFSWGFGVMMYLAARGYPIRTSAELISVLPNMWSWLIPLLGFLAVATSYIATAKDLEAALRDDYKLNAHESTAIALLTPLALFILIARDFLSTIGFVGAVFIGVNCIMVSLLALKEFHKLRRRLPRILVSTMTVFVISVYLFGIFQKLFSRESL